MYREVLVVDWFSIQYIYGSYTPIFIDNSMVI